MLVTLSRDCATESVLDSCTPLIILMTFVIGASIVMECTRAPESRRLPG